VQSDDVSINLIIGVDFVGTICLKSCVIFQVLPLSIFQPQYKELACPLKCLFIFSLWLSLFSLVYQNEAMSALDQLRKKNKQKGGIIEKKGKRKKQRKENYRKLERKFLERLEQSILNRLHQDHLRDSSESFGERINIWQKN
jgi:hypothetical protein